MTSFPSSPDPFPDPTPDPKPFRLEICPYGDMEIVLKSPVVDATYLVSSHQLCCTSPVFRASLGPQSEFLEAAKLRQECNPATTDGTEGESLYQMPINSEYDPTAVATVLYVLHGVAECVPQSIYFDNLLAIAIICDYYDCAGAMRPWDEVWMKPLKPLAGVAGCEGWLFIAWVFGVQEVFGSMTQRFSRCGVVMDEKFGVMVNKEVKKMHNHIPEGIIRDMAAQRLKAGDEISRSCRELYFRYDGDPSIKCAQEVKYCDYFVFAALHKGFTSLSLNVRNEDGGNPHLRESLTLATIIHDVKDLAADISQNLNNMTVGGQRHYYCNVVTEFVKELEAHVEAIDPLYLWSYGRKQPAVIGWDTMLRGKDAPTIPAGERRVVSLDICPGGDMEIVSDTDAVLATYTVSSRTLRASSSYFCECLGPKSAFAEYSESRIPSADPEPATESKSPSRFQFTANKKHDPTAVAVVLRILHAQTENFPTSIQFPALLAFAVVCEDYKCAAAAEPWAKIWMEQWRGYAEKPEYEDWLFISWVFGADNIFQSLTRKFAGAGIFEDREFVIAKDGEPKSTRKLGNYIPKEVTAAILAERKKAGEKIVKTCSDIYEKYSDNTTTKCVNPCQSPQTPQTFNKTCDNFMFGELHMGFKTSKILVKDFAIPSGTSIRDLVCEIVRLIGATAVNTQTVRIHGVMHNGCDAGINRMARDVQAALDGISPLPLTAFGRTPAKRSKVSWKRMLPVQIVVGIRGNGRIEEEADEDYGSVVSSSQDVVNGESRTLGDGRRGRRRGIRGRRGRGGRNQTPNIDNHDAEVT